MHLVSDSLSLLHFLSEVLQNNNQGWEMRNYLPCVQQISLLTLFSSIIQITFNQNAHNLCHPSTSSLQCAQHSPCSLCLLTKKASLAVKNIYLLTYWNYHFGGRMQIQWERWPRFYLPLGPWSSRLTQWMNMDESERTWHLEYKRVFLNLAHFCTEF